MSERFFLVQAPTHVEGEAGKNPKRGIKRLELIKNEEKTVEFN